MDYAKKPKLRYRGEQPDLPERRKKCISSREEEDVHAQRCPCGTATESRTHKVGEGETCKEERDGLEEEMAKLDEFDMEEFLVD